MGAFSGNFKFDHFSKICHENSILIKISQQQVLYKKTYVLVRYLAQFSSESETLNTKLVEKIKTHTSGSIIFFSRNSCRLSENVEQYN
jgi:hypothetical protein